MNLKRHNGIPILMYHNLGDAPCEEDVPYFVSQSNFYKQMRFLKWGGYKTITLDQLKGFIQGKKKIPKRSIIISFDDGYDSFEKIGVPILKKIGFSATMFIITSKINTPGYLGSESIRKLQQDGIQFESHSHTHPIITKLQNSEVKFELSESKKELESVLSSSVRFYAYRGGHYNENIKKMVQDEGYTAAVCSKPGLNNNKTNIFALRRMGIRGNDDLGDFARKLLGNTYYRRSVAYLIHFLKI